MFLLLLACLLFSLVYSTVSVVRVPTETFDQPELDTGSGSRSPPSLPFHLPLAVANASRQQTSDERTVRVQNLINFKESIKSGDCYQRDDQAFRFYCPSAIVEPNGSYHYVCISKEQLCNHIPDCPAAEDEDLIPCMFYESLRYELHYIKKLVATHYKRNHDYRRVRRSKNQLAFSIPWLIET